MSRKWHQSASYGLKAQLVKQQALDDIHALDQEADSLPGEKAEQFRQQLSWLSFDVRYSNYSQAEVTAKLDRMRKQLEEPNAQTT